MNPAFLTTIVCILFLAGCAPAPVQNTPTPEPTFTSTATPIPYRYLALGDSYTIGEGVSINQRFPILLTNALRENGLMVDTPIIIAQTGWTTDDLDNAIDEANPQGTFELVTLLIGVNDQFRGRYAEVYRESFRGLLERAIGFAGGDPGRVIVISIPDWGVTPSAAGMDDIKIGNEIDAFNKINREEAEKAGAHYINITGISRLAFEDRTLIARDGLHPTGKMYRMWVELLLPQALEILK